MLIRAMHLQQAVAARQQVRSCGQFRLAQYNFWLHEDFEEEELDENQKVSRSWSHEQCEEEIRKLKSETVRLSRDTRKLCM
jgi:hypothetical protein